MPDSIPATPINNPLLNLFLQTYKEFEKLDKDIILSEFVKISCVYPRYNDIVSKPFNIKQCDLYYPFFMLVAHYIVVGGYAVGVGINKPSGLVASSSIDSVSVSYQATPYNNNYDFFFGQTPYGMEYLAYIASITSTKIIN